MSVARLTRYVVAAFVLSFAPGGAATLAGPLGLVDDFSGDLSAWTSTRILDANGGGSNVSNFQINGGVLEIDTALFDGIEQTALTRTDFSLDVGEEYQADWMFGYMGVQDIGLYVGAGHPIMDVREDYVNVYVRENGQIFSRGFDGTSELGLAGGTAPGDIASLFIARTATDTFELGYYNTTLTRNVLTTRTLNNASIGNSIGVFADVSSTGIVGNLDDLRIAELSQLATATLVAPGVSTWTDPAVWSTIPFFPDNGNGGFNYEVIIDNGGTVVIPAVTNIVVDSVSVESGTVDVNGSLTALFGLANGGGGTITGAGTIAGLVINNGRVSPGGLGTFATLQIDDDYEQQSGGVLEIEVGDLMPPPGIAHDQLDVTGRATLAGRLELPIVFPFTPLDPTQEPPIVVLTATLGLAGRFDSVYLPNYGDLMPPEAEFAVRIETEPGMPGGLPGQVLAHFEAPTPGGPLAATGPIVEWSAPGTFTMPPDGTQIIELSNAGPVFQPQRVHVQNANAFVHRLIMVGTSSLDTMTVAVSDGRSLSATAGVIVGQNAIVELGSELPDGTTTTGNLVSARIDVDSGGRLVGIGTVVGDLNVGMVSGFEQATFAPGFSVGHVDVVGDYRQGEGGAFELDFESNGTGQPMFDTVNISGEFEPGGTLRVDASNLTTVPQMGTTFQVVSAASQEAGSVFSSVETDGNNAIFFAPVYTDDVAGGASGVGGASTSHCEPGMCVGLYSRGDMNRNGQFDMNGADINAFAVALTDPLMYFTSYGISGHISGSLDGYAAGELMPNNRLDFDDIDDFAFLMEEALGGSAASIVATLEALIAGVPEPSSALLLICGGGLLLTGGRRRSGHGHRNRVIHASF